MAMSTACLHEVVHWSREHTVVCRIYTTQCTVRVHPHWATGCKHPLAHHWLPFRWTRACDMCGPSRCDGLAHCGWRTLVYVASFCIGSTSSDAMVCRTCFAHIVHCVQSNECLQDLSGLQFRREPANLVRVKFAQYQKCANQNGFAWSLQPVCKSVRKLCSFFVKTIGKIRSSSAGANLHYRRDFNDGNQSLSVIGCTNFNV